tara:strand:+ start:2086 stop:2319 length:234 start_codon:yes stop_codon:yes gene_type:complete
MSDTIVHTGHCDTIIEDKHIIIDTFIKQDTVYIETQTYDKEIQIIETLINKPEFGKSFVSVLVLVFVCYTLLKKRKK